jgi:hypothetical protein
MDNWHPHKKSYQKTNHWMRENEESSAIWRVTNLLDLIRTYTTIINTGGEEQQLQQQQQQMQSLAKRKKIKYSFHLTIRRIVPITKQNTIHHHIKKSHTLHTKKNQWNNCTDNNIAKKYECVAQCKRTLTKSHQFIYILFKILLPNMSIIHINLLVVQCTHDVC